MGVEPGVMNAVREPVGGHRDGKAEVVSWGGLMKQVACILCRTSGDYARLHNKPSEVWRNDLPMWR